MRQKQANSRIRLLLALLVLVFAGTFARAVWLQVVSGDALAARAENQHRELVTIPAGRGTIFDRTGVQLAIGEQTTTVYADPRQVRNAARRRPRGARHPRRGAANALYPQLLDKRSQFVYVDGSPIRRRRELRREPRRRRVLLGGAAAYPQRSVAAQVIGYAGVDNKGLEGLEVGYDTKLAGRPGTETIVRDPFGRAIDVVSSTSEVEGSDVFTTVDHTIQANAEEVLQADGREVAREGRGRGRARPEDGAVLAMAQAPGYDANHSNRVPIALQRNRAVTDTYEPGSTFKLVTVTGALSEGLVARRRRSRSRTRSPWLTGSSTTPSRAARRR